MPVGGFHVTTAEVNTLQHLLAGISAGGCHAGTDTSG
jgi:hypothetical protein